jgi:hypothetical protein
MDLFELINHIDTNENAIRFLRDRGILRNVAPLCPLAACQREMTHKHTRIPHGKVWAK